MEHIGKVVLYLILAVNALFVGMLILSAYSPYLQPKIHPIASCLGLAFPIFLAVNICFTLFWVIISYRYALLPVIGFLVCIPQIRTYIPINSTVETIPDGSIKFLSYNVMGFNNLEKKEGKNPILSYLADSEADIICLQEYNSTKNKKYLTDEDIRKALKAYPYRSIHNPEKGGSQLACFSKFPILSARPIKYESTYNGSMQYTLKVNEDTITLINNHLESNKLTKEDKVIYEDMIKEHQGWELVGIYADEGISGTSLQHRDEFNRMIEDCKAGKIDLIVTKSVSRFARNIVDCIAKVRELGNMRPKVGVFFETEHIYTLDNTSEMMLAVLSAAAQEESHTKSEIMNISIEQRFSRGIFLTPKLLGYDVDEDGNLVINKEEAETVRLCYYLFLNGFPTAEIAEILMQLKRKTKLGNTKWSSGTVGSLLRNERYCGDVLSRKTFTPNYLDHKSKKNRHDRNQYRQTDHHEAIVDRDIYNAAQKMLTVTKYAKKGFPFPNLKVVDGGALKGFVSVNRSWTGFTVEDYKKASQSVYSDQNSIQDIEESKEEKKDGGFDLSGYEIVRAQFFSTRLNPAMTISEGRITFNTACLKKFEDVEYVEILFNSIERCIAVRPCDKDNINAVKWGTIRNGKWAVLPKSCRGFSEPLFELMDWNNECKYRFRGQYSKEDNEQILLFDLEEPEVIKHEIIQEDLPDTDTTETEENTVDTSKNKTKKIVRTLFPKQWQNHFGDSSEDVLLLHRVKYYGNWDVLRPAKIVEGLEPISENLLDKLNEEAQNMIEKMRCAV
mgnify:CR=1 FL=1